MREASPTILDAHESAVAGMAFDAVRDIARDDLSDDPPVGTRLLFSRAPRRSDTNEAMKDGGGRRSMRWSDALLIDLIPLASTTF